MSAKFGGIFVVISVLKISRATLLGAASVLAFSFGFESHAWAQSAPSNSPTMLSPVVVQSAAPERAKKRAAHSSRSARSAGRGRTTGRNAATADNSGAGVRPPESAFGHVDGIVANRSATGTKTDAALLETPAAISVVTQDQIQAQAAQSVSQAVRYVPGVRVEPAGADARADQVYIRGFLGDKYLDSLKVFSGGFAYNIIEPFNLERIEVLHGPASILYGQASPGGLVDMVSKRPTLEPYREMFLSTGNYGRIQGGIDLSGPVDKNKEWLYRITASGFDVGSQVDHTGYQRVSIAPSLTWRPTNDTTITFQGVYQKDPQAGFYNQLLSKGIGTVYSTPFGRIPTSFYAGEPGFDRTSREFGSIGYLAEHRFDNVWTVRQNLRYSDNDTYTQMVYPSGAGTPDAMQRNAFWTSEQLRSFQIDNQAEAKFSTGLFQHTMLFGVDYATGMDQTHGGSAADVGNINAFNPIYGTAVIPPMPFNVGSKQNFDQVGLYVQDQIKFDRWVATLGVRHDWADSCTRDLVGGGVIPSSDQATSKRAALLYKFDNGISPYIQYTESFQPIVGTAQRTASPFKPTTGQQEEVGIKYQPNSKTLLTAAVYNLTQQNVVMQDPNDSTNRIQTGEIRSRGVELEAKSEVSRNLTVLASYTYMDLLNTRAAVGVQGHRPIGLPANSATAWADYTFHGGQLDGFGLSGGVRYLGETFGDNANTFKVPSATLFDAGLHYDLAGLGPQFKGYNVQVNATNLFDKTYVSLCQNFGCYYGLRRSVIATLRYKW